MITYLAASRTLDFLIEGIEEYIGVTIISSQSEKLRQMIVTKLERGVTVYNGKGGYARSGEKKKLKYCILLLQGLNEINLTATSQKYHQMPFVVMHS